MYTIQTNPSMQESVIFVRREIKNQSKINNQGDKSVNKPAYFIVPPCSLYD
jgi:hypothetical protein